MMRKRYIPTYLAKSIYEVDPSFYQKVGVSVILSDLDNTLASYRTKDPSEETKALVRRLQEAGLRFYLVSNNTGKRVYRFADELGVKALSGVGKPLSGKLKRLLVKEGFPKEETLLVGDQILTDVISANGAGLRSLLTEPLSPLEPPWTKFNRIFDKPKRKAIIEEKLAKNWKETP
jgi:uncharacterized protein